MSQDMSRMKILLKTCKFMNQAISLVKKLKMFNKGPMKHVYFIQSNRDLFHQVYFNLGRQHSCQTEPQKITHCSDFISCLEKILLHVIVELLIVLCFLIGTDIFSEVKKIMLNLDFIFICDREPIF